MGIGGRPVNDVAPGDRDVAMVFQSYALYPHMTVAQNLGFGLRVRGADRAEVAERVERTADVLGLNELLDRRPGQLSGGQQQRVALGRAMVRDPGVFLFDEPLSNLDAGLRLRTRDEIAALHRRLGTTTIFVTHDQVEALSLGQRVAVMDRGRIQQVGTPREIYRRPGNLFVAGFVGSPPINQLHLTTRDDRLSGGPFVFPGRSPHPAATLGVRPEDLTITVSPPPTPAHPPGTYDTTPGTPAHPHVYSAHPLDPSDIPPDPSRIPPDPSPPPPHFTATVLRVESLRQRAARPPGRPRRRGLGRTHVPRPPRRPRRHRPRLGRLGAHPPLRPGRAPHRDPTHARGDRRP